MRRSLFTTPRIAASDITPPERYLSRRALLAGGVGLAAAHTLGAGMQSAFAETGDALAALRNEAFSVTERPTSFEDVSSYNNFYEFGTGKNDPARYAVKLRTRPWSVTVSGAAEITGTYTLEDMLKPHPLEERVYRLRCVEAWSMVIPWIGFPLGDLLKRFKPTSKAKYVIFKTLKDMGQMRGQREPVLDWPYTEGLRMDEAMHPLALLAVGMYGRVLPNQDGAPLRLVVPWKYGFKSIKSIVSIQFADRAPRTAWAIAAPEEYGFYANVNPAVDHPRWSQASERRIGDGLFAQRHPTLPFNGYASDVASLYSGMDLRRNF